MEDPVCEVLCAGGEGQAMLSLRLLSAAEARQPSSELVLWEDLLSSKLES